jgi:DNA-binding MarR family transcriptional regulator/regulator of replication initiation timing
MDKDNVKDAFERVKTDITSLRSEFDSLKNALIESRNQLIDLCSILQNMHKRLEKIENTEKVEKQAKTQIPTQDTPNPATPTHNPTDNLPFKPLKDGFLGISTGNGGVPTDRQTHQQTDNPAQNPLQTPQKQPNVEDVTKILDSLDTIKKEIRLKFRRLTDQEMLIFSTIYQIEQESGFSDYKTIAERIKLTESSVRDYVGRLIKKGIPIIKTTINNKTINLTISDNLKKIASLSTIIQLRDL